jgi:hypothetical protein
LQPALQPRLIALHAIVARLAKLSVGKSTLSEQQIATKANLFV